MSPQVLEAALGLLLVLALLAWVFDRWAWAWPGARAIVGRPDLRGTWGGVIRSSWAGSSGGAKLAPIESYLVVRQTLRTIRVQLFTSESRSATLAASIVSEANGGDAICGIYRSEPRLSVRDRSPIHHGGIVLRSAGSPPASISGQYWTDRRSMGELDFRLLTRRCVGDFQTARSMDAATARPAREHVDWNAGERSEKHLPDEVIHALHNAAIACNLSRETLLASLEPGIVAQLPIDTRYGSQVMSDLHALNKIPSLIDGSVPIQSWLATAAQLSAPRRESKVFEEHLTTLTGRAPAARASNE